MQVVLAIGRRVEVHDAGNRVDMDAPRRDVGGNESLDSDPAVNAFNARSR